MTRDHSTNPSLQRAINKPTANHHQHQHYPNQARTVQFKPFSLFSHDDISLKRAVELVESASLNRFKVCVVSVIGKDSLDESVKNHLIQSLFANNHVGSNKKKQKYKSQRGSSQTEPKVCEQQSKDLPTTTTSLINEFSDLSLDSSYENQVLGQVDSNSGIILLNLTSFLEADKLCSLSEVIANLSDDRQQEEQPILSGAWPDWSQNLIKTMLILLIVSHVVVFYNTEPSIDYSLIQIFKILETLRLKSQTRVTDLLESIASKQMFPAQWIRQGRVSCPRALFLCDTTYLGVPIVQNDIVSLKRDLEDQIYKLLKKTEVISSSPNPNQPTGQNCSSLFHLPERDDFVFVITRQDIQSGYATSRFNRVGVQVIKEPRKEDFYLKFLKSIQTGDTEGELNVQDHEEDSQKRHIPLIQCISGGDSIDSQPSPLKQNSLSHNRFRKFIYKHISTIQAASQAEIDSKHHHGSARQPNALLPRYDDFFTVLIRLKNLFFPKSNLSETDNLEEESKVVHAETWSGPDERRFVDIYDLVNTDVSFSELHCYKTRMAAFDFYVRDLQSLPLSNSSHEQSKEAARKLYLNHARGSARSTHLGQLCEQCQRHWENIGHSKPSSEDVKRLKSNNLSRSYSSNVVAHPSVHRSNSTSPSGQITSRNNLSISRRANGIKMMTCCDCGRRSNYMITPVDRKKKLERVDIHRLND